MTLKEFLEKHNGKFLEVAGSIGAEDQCVDLANGYIRDVLKLPIIEWTNAVDFPAKALASGKYDYIKNTPEAIPMRGDLIVWGGQIGHIAIFIKGDVNWFTSFDQNWPTGSFSHYVDHSYNNVKGWLRPKGINMSDDLMQIEIEVFERLVPKSGRWDETVAYLEIEEDPFDTPFDKVKSIIAGFKSRGTDQEQRAIKAEAEVKNREEQVIRLKKQLLDEEQLRKDLNDKLKNALKDYGLIPGVYEARLKEMQGQIDTMAVQKGKYLTRIAELETEGKKVNAITAIVMKVVEIIKKLISGLR